MVYLHVYKQSQNDGRDRVVTSKRAPESCPTALGCGTTHVPLPTPNSYTDEMKFRRRHHTHTHTHTHTDEEAAAVRRSHATNPRSRKRVISKVMTHPTGVPVKDMLRSGEAPAHEWLKNTKENTNLFICGWVSRAGPESLLRI